MDFVKFSWSESEGKLKADLQHTALKLAHESVALVESEVSAQLKCDLSVAEV